MLKLTREEIEAGRSDKGGWTKKQLAKWAVPWPPPGGWKYALENGKPIPTQRKKRMPKEAYERWIIAKAARFANAGMDREMRERLDRD